LIELHKQSKIHFMSSISYVIVECNNHQCGLRFPAPVQDENPLRCPKCRSEVSVVAKPKHDIFTISDTPIPSSPDIEVLLDNIRSTFNVGAMFRTCDGANIRHIHLCGITTLPGNPKVFKTALGAEQSVPWTHYNNGVKAALDLREKGYRLWALENCPRSESIFNCLPILSGSPIVLAVGNEVTGVDPGIMELCERVLYIPMSGIKHSLNVAIAFGIAVYFLKYGAEMSGYQA
jgi:23S rRNA (guanosine2251-2'-O)-methyltransferase